LNPFECSSPIETESGWTVQTSLTAESPYLRGHFPGRPILPAVAQLAALTQATRSAWDREVHLSAIKDLRFRQPLFPGAELELRLGAFAGADDTRFGIFLEGKPVSQGAVSWTEEALTELPGHAVFEAKAPSGPPILLPQEAEARYIHECLRSDEDSLECLAFVPGNNPFRTESAHGCVIPAFLALEMGAQAAATHEGVMRSAEGGEASAVGGYVVRCRQASFELPQLPADAAFRVMARCMEAAPPLRTYRVEIALEEQVVVRGLVSTFADA